MLTENNDEGHLDGLDLRTRNETPRRSSPHVPRRSLTEGSALRPYRRDDNDVAAAYYYRRDDEEGEAHEAHVHSPHYRRAEVYPALELVLKHTIRLGRLLERSRTVSPHFVRGYLHGPRVSGSELGKSYKYSTRPRISRPRISQLRNSEGPRISESDDHVSPIQRLIKVC